MKNGLLKERGSSKYMPVIIILEVHPQKKKEVLYLVEKEKIKRTTEHYGYKL